DESAALSSGALQWARDVPPHAADERQRGAGVGPSGTLAMRAEWLDLASVRQASPSVSSGGSLDKLVGTLFRIVIEQGGAQKGYLVTTRDGEPRIDAEAWLDEDGV